MRSCFVTRFVFMVAGLFLIATGCGDQPSAENGKSNGESVSEDGHTGGHGHSTTGPHGGSIIELGEEEYHAELVHEEEADQVVIYILDSSATKPVPIEAKEIVINLIHHGEPEQHKLIADPLAEDGPGKSSRFVGKDNPDLNEDLQHHDANARFSVSIDGTPYSGQIEPDNDQEHGEHSHEHEPTKHE